MTVQNLDPEIIYNGTGSVTIFTFAFEADSPDFILATVDGSDTHPFSVTMNPDQDSNPGGILTFDTAPDSGAVVVIFRKTDVTQETEYPNYARFPASSHERALDKLTMIVQEIIRSLANLWRRAILFPELNPLNNTVPSVEDRKNKFFFFDANGNPAVSSGTGGDGNIGGDCSILFKVGLAPGFNDGTHCDQTCYAISIKWYEDNMGIGRDCEGTGLGIEVDNDAHLGRIMHGAYVNATNFSGPNGTVPSGLILAHKISPYLDPDAVVVGVDKVGDIWRYYADPSQPGLENFKGNWERLSKKADLNGSSSELFNVKNPDLNHVNAHAINQLWLYQKMGIGYSETALVHLDAASDKDLHDKPTSSMFHINADTGGSTHPEVLAMTFSPGGQGASSISLLGITNGGELWIYSKPQGTVASETLFEGTWRNVDGIPAHVALDDPHTQYLKADDLPSALVDWFTDTTSTINGAFKVLAESQSGNPESSVSGVATTEGIPVLIHQWLRENPFPSPFNWMETYTTFVLDIDCDQNNGEVHLQIFLRKSDSTEILMQTTPRIPLQNGRREYSLTIHIPGPIEIEIGDNIITRMYINKNGAAPENPTATFYMENGTASRMITVIPIPTYPGPHAVNHEIGGSDQIIHANLSGASGFRSHAQVDAHIDDTGNPHNVTRAQLNAADLNGSSSELFYVSNPDLNHANSHAISQFWLQQKMGIGYSTSVLVHLAASSDEDLHDKPTSSMFHINENTGGSTHPEMLATTFSPGGQGASSISLLGITNNGELWLYSKPQGTVASATLFEGTWSRIHPTVTPLVAYTRPFEYTFSTTTWIEILFEQKDKETDSAALRQKPTNKAVTEVLADAFFKIDVSFWFKGPVELALKINGTVDTTTIRRWGFSGSSEDYNPAMFDHRDYNAGDEVAIVGRQWGSSNATLQPYGKFFMEKKAD